MRHSGRWHQTKPPTGTRLNEVDDMANGLVLFYPLACQSSRVCDLSYKENPGYAVGNPLWYGGAWGTKAPYVDNVNWIECGLGSEGKQSITGQNHLEYTWVFWLSTTFQPGGAGTVISAGNQKTDGNWTLVNIAGGIGAGTVTLRQWTSSYQDTATGNEFWEWNTTPRRLVAIVVSAATQRCEIWVNGRLCATGSTYGDTAGSHSYICLGRNSNGSGPYSSLVEGFGWWNRPLHAKELLALWAEPFHFME